MDDTQADREDDHSFIQTVTDSLLLPVRVATSPLLLRTYLRTILLFITCSIFFGFAIVAYSSFYYSYIPVRGISVPVYLQYDHGSSSSRASCVATSSETLAVGKAAKWPYGIANVPGLVDRQKYDVVVEMEVPRSDNNLKVGNWMVGLELRGPAAAGSAGLEWEDEWNSRDHDSLDTTPPRISGDKAVVLAKSRRPAILTYRSRVIEMAHRFLRLPFYLVGWHTESDHVEVSMMESVAFAHGHRNIPTSLRLELRSKQPLEVYRVKVRISARLEGLRWLMYKHWLTSAVVGTSLFWSVEMAVLLFTWAFFTLLFGRSGTTPPAPPTSTTRKHVKAQPDGDAANSTAKLKLEPSEDAPASPFSDTSRVFPTLPSLQPLAYTSAKEEPRSPRMEDVPLKEDTEADDEDDDFVLEDALPPRKREGEARFEDSGLGTSLESGGERGVSRRRSGKGRG